MEYTNLRFNEYTDRYTPETARAEGFQAGYAKALADIAAEVKKPTKTFLEALKKLEAKND